MIHRRQRDFHNLPVTLLAGALLVFCLQLLVHHQFDHLSGRSFKPLQPPLGDETYRQLSMGSTQLLSYWLNIKLQLHDSQGGAFYRYDRLDYDRLVDWLDVLTELNPVSEYSMLLASRIYSQVGDRQKLRSLLNFIVKRFDDDPQLHWRRLAEASVIARHRLGDLDLALEMATRLALQPPEVQMPHWARDLRFLLLAEMNEHEAAITIIQALLASNSIDDPDELRFLKQKLTEFRQLLLDSRQKAESGSR